MPGTCKHFVNTHLFTVKNTSLGRSKEGLCAQPWTQGSHHAGDCSRSTQSTCSILEDFLGVVILGWVSQDE